MNKLSLFIFVDALGWEIFKRSSFLKKFWVDRKPLKTILGYSSACDPSIISGRFPSQHGHWSSFYYSPATSPFRPLKWLRFVPKILRESSRFRHLVSRAFASLGGHSGYVQLYNVPFEHLPLFDYVEKKWMWGVSNGLAIGPSIFDHLLKNKIPFYVKPSVTVSDEEQWEEVKEKIRKKSISFAYLFLGALDATMHAHGTSGPAVDALLKQYDKQIRDLVHLAKEHYREVSWYVFSDHGMHDVKEVCDLQKILASLNLGLKFGEDYVAMYDSTMARFWTFNSTARQKLLEGLKQIPQGRILDDEELKKEGVFFPDRRFGDVIFLLNPGVLLVPSYMGRKRIPGMHGYAPSDADSTAMICSNRWLPTDLEGIEQIFWLMVQETQPTQT